MDRVKELAAEARAKLQPSDSLTSLTRVDPRVGVQSTGSFTLSAPAPGVGRDMAFVGALGGLRVGEISPPVMGTRGAYLIQLVSKSPFDTTAYNAQKELLRARALQEKRGRFLTEWVTKLKERADIEDKRDVFYR